MAITSLLSSFPKVVILIGVLTLILFLITSFLPADLPFFTSVQLQSVLNSLTGIVNWVLAFSAPIIDVPLLGIAVHVFVWLLFGGITLKFILWVGDYAKNL